MRQLAATRDATALCPVALEAMEMAGFALESLYVASHMGPASACAYGSTSSPRGTPAEATLQDTRKALVRSLCLLGRS